MSKDNLFLCSLLVVGFTGLGALMLNNIRDLENLRVELRTDFCEVRSAVRVDVGDQNMDIRNETSAY